MSASQAYQSAWEAYQQAVDDLYAAPVEAARTMERGAGEVSIEDFEARGDTLLNRSEGVRVALVDSLETENASQRELAALKLLAAAAYDLSVASDLMEMEEAGPATRLAERGSRSGAVRELSDVLEAPLEGGMAGLLLDADRAATPDDPEAARAQLEDTIFNYLENIPEDAADLSETAVGAVVGLGLSSFKWAALVPTQEILALVPDGLSIVRRRAASLMVEAITKLRAAIGDEQEGWIREKVAGWLDDIQKDRDTVTGLLDKLYQTGQIKQEVVGLIEAPPVATTALGYNQATQALNELLATYGKTKNVLAWVMRIAALAKLPLMGLTPWGPLAVYGTYLGILSYAIYSGGDYLDWYRTGEQEWLDRVPGLRTTVRRSVGAPDNT